MITSKAKNQRILEGAKEKNWGLVITFLEKYSCILACGEFFKSLRLLFFNPRRKKFRATPAALEQKFKSVDFRLLRQTRAASLNCTFF